MLLLLLLLSTLGEQPPPTGSLQTAPAEWMPAGARQCKGHTLYPSIALAASAAAAEIVVYSNVTLCRGGGGDGDDSNNGCNGAAQSRSSRREFNWMGARFSLTDYIYRCGQRAPTISLFVARERSAQEPAAGRDLTRSRLSSTFGLHNNRADYNGRQRRFRFRFWPRLLLLLLLLFRLLAASAVALEGPH